MRLSGIAWHMTARYPTVLGLDFRALIAFGVWFLHMSWPTFYVAVVGVMFFALLKWIGYTPTIAFRAVRRRLAGKKRPAPGQHAWRWRAGIF